VGIYVVEYVYTDDTDLRDRLRPKHRDLMSALADTGVNLGSGILGPDEPPGALLIVRASSKDEALQITAADPFRAEGAVASVTVREFIPFFGVLANA
jgi:uncharacterized protein YciI